MIFRFGTTASEAALSMHGNGLARMLLVSLAIALTACGKERSAGSGGAVPIPDASTFFPLLAGSFWVYQETIHGESQGRAFVDSILSLAETDSGYSARMRRTFRDGASNLTEYHVDRSGLIQWKSGEGDVYKPFMALHPRLGQEFGKDRAHPCQAESIAVCVLIQEHPADAPERPGEDPYDWQGRWFRKGIGLESESGYEISFDLVEYRIGSNGPVVRLRPDPDALPLSCAVPESEGRCPSLLPDFDGDGLVDTLRLVRLHHALPSRAAHEILNPFGKDEEHSLPDSLLVRVDMSAGPDHILHDRAYFTTPIWDNPAERLASLSIIPASAAPFPETDDEVVPKAKGDRVVFPTEAGIDIYLYYTDRGFQVFWPKEEP